MRPRGTLYVRSIKPKFASLCCLFQPRMVVELHRKVSSLIEYLKQKWAHQDHQIVSFRIRSNTFHQLIYSVFYTAHC